MKSINPYSEKAIKTYTTFKSNEIFDIINEANTSFNDWKNIPLKNRINIILKIKQNLIDDKLESAKEITSEMGKPLSESLLEIDKCVWLCDYYIENSEKLLKPEFIKTEAHKSYITFEPLGIILGIMPWNFPFWQVFRFVIPTIISGNVTIIKHAPNVTGCCLKIKKIFSKNIDYKVLQPLVIDVDEIENIIKNPLVKGVSLTGSDKAGSAVGKITGKYIKKILLELGGSDAFIVCEDADIDKAAKMAVMARMLNTGQSCIAAKRFIIHKNVKNKFINHLVHHLNSMKIGDPMLKETQIGPLARKDLLNQLNLIFDDALTKGANIIYQTKDIPKNGYFFRPSIIDNINSSMKAYNCETFGPLFSIYTFQEESEAISLANDTHYGLGGSVWSKNIKNAEKLAKKIYTGAVFINEMTKSDPRLPFGGVGLSGIGRELGSYGIKEFVNVKTIYID
tara:strand:- start:3639 stop:4994 length:1356 start_codon:yes stop_codon:yes gene_type:complete